MLSEAHNIHPTVKILQRVKSVAFSTAVLPSPHKKKLRFPLWANRVSSSPVVKYYSITSPHSKNVPYKDQRVQLLAPHKTPQESHPVSKSIVQTFTELCQPRICDHSPGEPLLALNHPLGEELFCNIQPKRPLTQLQGHSLGSCHWSPHRSDQSLFLCFPLMRKL